MLRLTATCLSIALAVAGVLLPAVTHAGQVNLTENRPYVEVDVRGTTVRIQRVQDPDHHISGFYAKTSRPCPPFCIHPMQAAPGVRTVGEVEVFDFIAGELRNGTGLLVDARTPDWYTRMTIPGAINLPWTTLAEANPNDPGLQQALDTLGVTRSQAGTGLLDTVKGLFGGRAAENTGGWDFSAARELLLFCNGAWCDQSPRAIAGLLKLGYPAEKLRYYRGGMNAWEMFGLTTIPGR